MDVDDEIKKLQQTLMFEAKGLKADELRTVLEFLGKIKSGEAFLAPLTSGEVL